MADYSQSLYPGDSITITAATGQAPEPGADASALPPVDTSAAGSSPVASDGVPADAPSADAAPPDAAPAADASPAG